MNLATGDRENKINKANSMWSSVHKTFKKGGKAQHFKRRILFILFDT